MKSFDINRLKLGILGGGQLGKMLCQAASRWNLHTSVLDPSAECPAATLASSYSRGEFADYNDVYEFGKSVDILTIEIEHVSTEALYKLEETGLPVYPAPRILELIQDKGKQKKFYREKKLPTSDFKILNGKNQILGELESGEIKLPFVQKSCKHGYDGKGVQIIKTSGDLDHLLDCESVIEKLVDIEKEISVIVAKSPGGEVSCFEPVEMVFNSDANLVEFLICPCDLDDKYRNNALDLAKQTVTELGLTGILAVEMFIDTAGNLMINEVAPRPHNSGHHTIESAVTSQYEQCLRAILDLPLGNTDIKIPSVMVNLLGDPEQRGITYYEGLVDCMKIEGASIHLYGKKETKPFRKMGHVTVVDKDLSRARKKALHIKNTLRVISK